MGINEVFSGAGATPRSHNLAASRSSSHIVYSSGVFLVVETVPNACSEVGRVVSVSECYHTKPITVVKRTKNCPGSDFFVSGGADGLINIWKLEGATLIHVFGFEAAKASIVSVSAAVRSDEIVVTASWGQELSGGLKSWWLKRNGSQMTIEAFADFSDSLLKRSFVLAMDCHVMTSGLVLIAVGTSLRKIELYAENGKSFSRRLSVVGHTDWIHSIAFNDSHEKLLLASAGQDTYVKLWKIEKNLESGDDEELSVTKNKFTIENGDQVTQLIFNVEAVIGGHEDWVHSTEWNSDGSKLVTASSDKTVIVWEEQNELWSDTVRLGIVGGQAAGFFAAIFTPDSRRIVATSYFGGLYCWAAGETADALWSPITMCGGHVGEVRDVSWSPSGDYLLSVGKDQTTRLFAPQTKTGDFVEIARPQVHGYDMQCIISISNSCFVSGGEEKIYRAFRAPETFANSLCAISGLSKEEVFSNQQLETFGARLPALGLSNKAIDEGEKQPDEEVHWEEAGFQANPENLTFPPSEDCLQQNTLWPELHKLYAHGFEVYAVACNPNGTVLATACKASQAEHAAIILWEVGTWAKKNTIPGHTLTVTQIEWSRDGRHLLSVSRDRTAVLYRETSGNLDGFSYEKVWMSGKEHSRIIWACAWMEDSGHFMTASRDMKVILWKLGPNGATVAASTKLNQPITAISTGSGSISHIIACGMQDGSVSLLSLENNQFVPKDVFLSPIVTTDSAVLRLRFHPKSSEDSQLLAYAGVNGLLRILRISL